MQTHYEHSLLGCREAGTKPVSFWRFHIAYGRYEREFRAKLEQHWDDLTPTARHRLVIDCQWLIGIANLVRPGEKIAETAARLGDLGDDPGTAEAGTREPRTPLTPVLVGCAACSFPTSDTLKDSYDWRI
jgi:hypothetical protein